MGIISVLLFSNRAYKEFTVPGWVILSRYIVMGLGTPMGGWRIVHFMGSKITRLTPMQGGAIPMSMRPAKQVGALPWRRKGKKIEILLVTSRETRRWVIPKGWPFAGLKDFTAARREAFEEAGVEGHMRKRPIGRYDYDKRLADGDVQPCRVWVFALEVTDEKKRWPEKRERKRRWFSAKEAAAKVDEPGLRKIIAEFSLT